MTIRDIAARGFTAGVEAYERGRPGYPADAARVITEVLDLRPGRTILELGAGTGKLTRLLAPSGARVLALEPVPAMRAKLAQTVPAAQVMDGTAESIPLPGASVDAVVVAQAFHWFDAIRALSEVHRVLRPGGRLLLAWNRRDESVSWVRELGDRVRTLAGDEPQVRDDAWRRSLARCALLGSWESWTTTHAQALTREGVLDRAASVSYVAAASPEARAEVLAGVLAAIDADPATAGRETVELPYRTEVMWAGRRTIEPGDEGVVASVNLGSGGVPKPPVDGARILAGGLEGDGHHEPEPVHGGPDAAVSLYAQEAIERVREDGHEAFPGACGENLTLLGIDWAALAAGDRLAVGDLEEGALLELTGLASPRRYARVLREGPGEPGMSVRRVPPG